MFATRKCRNFPSNTDLDIPDYCLPIVIFHYLALGISEQQRFFIYSLEDEIYKFAYFVINNN